MHKAELPETRPLAIPIGPRLEAVLEVAYRARRAVLLEGPTGIGKSEIVRRVAERLGIETVVLDLSLLEPPDLVGLPVIANGRTTYAVPRILPEGGAGILMLEELNRAERYIQQPALQLLTARRLHEYTLPEGWVCFAAVNPETADYQVTPLDRALRARFMNLSVRADRAAWLAWAQVSAVHPAIIALAQSHERILDDVPPRTWTYASQIDSDLWWTGSTSTTRVPPRRASFRIGMRCGLETKTFLPHKTTCFAWSRSKTSLLSSSPKSRSWAASPAPEQMSPRFCVTGPKRSKK